MYHQSFRHHNHPNNVPSIIQKRVLLLGPPTRKKGLGFFGGEKESAIFTWNLVGQSQDYNIYRPITIHPTTMYHQSFRKGSFFWGHLPGKGAWFFGGKRKVQFLREIWWGSPRIIYIQTNKHTNIHEGAFLFAFVLSLFLFCLFFAFYLKPVVAKQRLH